MSNEVETGILAVASTTGISALVFRIRDCWLALPTTLLHRVVDIRPPHTIPGRTDTRLRGIVNAGGELALCFSLADILGIGQRSAEETEGQDHPRLVVVGEAKTRTAFIADAILGVYAVSASDLEAAAAATAPFDRYGSMFKITLGGVEAGFLDDRIFNEGLTESLCHEAG